MAEGRKMAVVESVFLCTEQMRLQLERILIIFHTHWTRNPFVLKLIRSYASADDQHIPVISAVRNLQTGTNDNLL